MISVNTLALVVLAPLLGSLLSGLLGRQLGRTGAHTVTILGVAVSCTLSLYVLKQLLLDGAPAFNENVYTFYQVGQYQAHVGFLVDRLSALMMVVVTSVSLLVHVYTIGYMAGDPGYQRFFSYISLFTFSMLMLVMSNNFLQLFFGWEAVGLVSYLLIGFWFKRPTAVFANMKAFIVNRVGDFGFLLGIAAVLFYAGSLDYATVFAAIPSLQGTLIEPWAGMPWEAVTFICICLFVGAMGKSAQVPLHVWLPDSMEGPTPISALIHAATMVTAGIFMVSRMSPLFEHSQTALDFVLFIGATTALFTGFMGMVQNDIKRVVAYSTLSQLGYMTVALGASAYSVAMFHLMTHAFFKALLFLGAGSVIMAMHHEQDMRYMGGLRRYMPVTFATAWIGTLALVGMPFFSGFYSKDLIIDVVGESAQHGHWVHTYARWAVLAGVFVTAFYSFRLLYLTFHGRSRFVVEESHHHHDVHDAPGEHRSGHLQHVPHESPWVVTVPLVLLAIPSLAIGFFTAAPMLHGFFGEAIFMGEGREAWQAVVHEFQGPVSFALHGFTAPAFWIALAGFAVATYLYRINPAMPARIAGALRPLVRLLQEKYYFDHVYQAVFARGSLWLGRGFWKVGDVAVIDDGMVNGSASAVAGFSAALRRLHSGYLYHYAFAMIIGLIVLLAWFRGLPSP